MEKHQVPILVMEAQNLKSRIAETAWPTRTIAATVGAIQFNV